MAYGLRCNLLVVEVTRTHTPAHNHKRKQLDEETIESKSSPLASPRHAVGEERKGMLLMQPPLVSSRFHSLYFIPRHHHRLFQRPISAFSATASCSPSSSSSYFSSWNGLDASEEEEDEFSTFVRRRYDFSPLLKFLSRFGPVELVLDSVNLEPLPVSLDPVEFELAESYKAVPAPYWHSLLKSLCSSRPSLGLAYAVVSWLERHNLCFSYELLYSILIHALGRSEKLYEAFLLSQKQTLTPLTYNALIGACARNNDIDKALNLISRMRQDGYQSDFVNYSLVIQALTRSNKIDSALLQSLYREIKHDKLELDVQLVNDLIMGFAKSGDPSRALQLLGMAQSTGLSAKTATLVSIISALANSGRTLEAEALFEELRQSGIKPRTKAYNALLRGYVKTGPLRDAESMVSEMEKSGVSPDEHTYSLLIDAYVNAGRWESARIVLKEMEAGDVQPNSFVFSRLLAGYRDRGEWQKTFQVLKEMKSIGVKPDTQFYNVVIDTFGKFNCLDHAMTTFDRMLSEGIEPDRVTWNTLIDCHCKHGRHIVAQQMFEAMEKRGCLPCATTYNIMINSYGDQERWDDMKRLLGKMKSQGVLPNVVTHTTLVDVYGKSGRFNDAIDCLEEMKSVGLKPSSTMYNALINAYAQRVSCLLIVSMQKSLKQSFD